MRQAFKESYISCDGVENLFLDEKILEALNITHEELERSKLDIELTDEQISAWQEISGNVTYAYFPEVGELVVATDVENPDEENISLVKIQLEQNQRSTTEGKQTAWIIPIDVVPEKAEMNSDTDLLSPLKASKNLSEFKTNLQQLKNVVAQSVLRKCRGIFSDLRIDKQGSSGVLMWQGKVLCSNVNENLSEVATTARLLWEIFELDDFLPFDSRAFDFSDLSSVAEDLLLVADILSDDLPPCGNLCFRVNDDGSKFAINPGSEEPIFVEATIGNFINLGKIYNFFKSNVVGMSWNCGWELGNLFLSFSLSPKDEVFAKVIDTETQKQTKDIIVFNLCNISFFHFLLEYWLGANDAKQIITLSCKEGEFVALKFGKKILRQFVFESLTSFNDFLDWLNILGREQFHRVDGFLHLKIFNACKLSVNDFRSFNFKTFALNDYRDNFFIDRSFFSDLHQIEEKLNLLIHDDSGETKVEVDFL